MAHYFDDPVAPSSPRTVSVDVPGAQFEMETDRGVFSYGRLDLGTAVLLRAVPAAPAEGIGLDLGCGAGPIALSMAIRAPRLQVVAVDVNERARQLCTTNAARLGLNNLSVHGPEELAADQHYDVIWSNPPIRVGKEALHELVTTWLARLTPRGEAFLVMQKNLGADSFHRWLHAAGHPVDRIHSSKGYRVLRVRGSGNTATGVK